MSGVTIWHSADFLVFSERYAGSCCISYNYMNTCLVLTVIADDKPGLVETLAEVIADHKGSWLESSMSQLAGKFAGILRVSVATNRAQNLIDALSSLPAELKLVVEQAEAEELPDKPTTVGLNLMGNERPGIIREISHALAMLSVNVEQLSTHCDPAPMSGDVLFRARAVLQVPTGMLVEDLQEVLERLADDLIVELKDSSPGTSRARP